jgi:hypothetical protein
MSRRAAVLIVRLAAFLLPASMRDWARAMEAEVDAIGRGLPALRFALGCLGCAIAQALRVLISPSSPRPTGLRAESRAGRESDAMKSGDSLLHRPRRFATVCAVGAIGLGLAYMTAGGAPARYLAMNCAALGLGLILLGVSARAAPAGNRLGPMLDLILASALLLTALLGISAAGAARWISVGGILLQPALFLLPVLALRFVRRGDAPSTVAILIAAAALALQPDRAMAGALAAGMVVLAFVRRDRNVLIAAGGALAAFAWTLIRPDASPAMPFVDRIFYASFDIHPLAGAAVIAGALLMLLPAAAGLARDAANRDAYAVFGALWLAVILAAALGNYPTPLVGYGGSAILGYLVSLIGLPPRAGIAGAAQGDPDRQPKEGTGLLRVHLATSG